MIKAVLLDIDGTLLDSNDAHARTWVETLSAHGHPMPFERVRRLIGKGADKLLAELLGLAVDSPEGQALRRERSRHFLAHELPHLKPTRGARALLQRLRDEGLRRVVATSAGADERKHLLHAAGVADLVEDATDSGDVDRSKPDPDVVHAALQRAGVPPQQALMLGDTPYDVQAAGRAGVATIALRCGGWDDAALGAAAAVYDDPADLLAAWDRSPLARG